MISFVSLCARVRPRPLARLLCSQTHPHTRQIRNKYPDGCRKARSVFLGRFLDFFSSFFHFWKLCFVDVWECSCCCRFRGLLFFLFLFFGLVSLRGESGRRRKLELSAFFCIFSSAFLPPVWFSETLQNEGKRKWLEFCAYLAANFCCCCFSSSSCVVVFFLQTDRQTRRRSCCRCLMNFFVRLATISKYCGERNEEKRWKKSIGRRRKTVGLLCTIYLSLGVCCELLHDAISKLFLLILFRFSANFCSAFSWQTKSGNIIVIIIIVHAILSVIRFP